MLLEYNYGVVINKNSSMTKITLNNSFYSFFRSKIILFNPVNIGSEFTIYIT